MSGTVNLNSPTACYVDATGIHAPTYTAILNFLISQYQAIYGADTYLGNDSQDGQLLGVFAAAINDANAATVAVFNSFSPSFAQGVGLSSLVKINGLARNTPSNGSVTLTIIGQQGTQILNGVATDANQNSWVLPATVIIPSSGQISVTAIAATAGNIIAPANTVNTIGTPTRGWQSVNNPADASPGQPVQTDASLRSLQSVSTALPAQGVLDGIVASIYQITGVTRVQPYENASSLTDSNGVPPHSIALVVEGGSAQTIGNTIQLKKPPGCGTYGTTTVTVTDNSGNARAINFFRPISVSITALITLTPLAGYTSTIGANLINGVIASITANPIGTNIIRSYLFAIVYNTSLGIGTFDLRDIALARSGAALASNDVNMAFNEAGTATTTTVTIVIG